MRSGLIHRGISFIGRGFALRIWCCTQVVTNFLCGRNKDLFFINLASILIFGVLGCAWVLYFSDWFEVIGGLLTLGGALTWLAFVSKVIPAARLNEFQNWVEANLFERNWTLVISALFLLGEVLLLSLCLGTVQVESMREQNDLVLFVYRLGSTKGDPLRLPPGGSLRVVRWTTWWSKAHYVVKVSGYPDRVEELLPLGRRTLRVPSSFRRPVVVIRPGLGLAQILESNPEKLKVIVQSDGKSTPLPDIATYHGQAVWIGCDADVRLPSRIQEEWFEQLKAARSSRLARSWMQPEALGGQPIILKAGDTLDVQLLNERGDRLAQEKVDVQAPLGEDFVTLGILQNAAN
jgi:hypothetical protein